MGNDAFYVSVTKRETVQVARDWAWICYDVISIKKKKQKSIHA